MADRSKTLQQAASTIFVLTAVLPLLVFMWTLHTLGVLHSPTAQVGLGLSLVFALTGFFILRTTMLRLSEFTRALTKAAESKVQGRPPGPGIERPSNRKAVATPAVGAISEFGDMSATIASLWSREAVPHIGRPVLVSVVHATEPLAGTLKEVTEEGLLLEQNGKEVAVGYQRISGIEAQR